MQRIGGYQLIWAKGYYYSMLHSALWIEWGVSTALSCHARQAKLLLFNHDSPLIYCLVDQDANAKHW